LSLTELGQPNFYSLISEKTEDFSGREWIFNEIDNWLNVDSLNRQRYFIVTGKAASGKSTIAARLIEISNGIIKRSNAKNDDQDVNLPFKKIKNDFLDALYIISFKDNLSTDPKTFSRSLSHQLAYKNGLFARELISSTKTSNFYDIDVDASNSFSFSCS
jgi:predicted ATPase